MLLILLLFFAAPIFAQTLEDGCWLSGAPLPTPRQEMQQVLLNGKIFVIGGFIQGGIGTDLVEVYDPQNNTWSTSTPLPQKMHHISTAEVNGKIYVLGGFLNNTFQATDAVYEFDPATPQWRIAINCRWNSAHTLSNYTACTRHRWLSHQIVNIESCLCNNR
jgi:N-acetylneuraminic acid mutarotase